MSPLSLVLSVLSTTPLASSPGADDWPHWGGPMRTGVSNETDWDAKGKAEPLWRAEVGLGYSSVAVVDGRLYTLGFDREAELDLVHCVDALTGEELWVHSYPSKIWDQYHGGGTLTTPTVAGGRVYVSEREGLLQCLDAETGDLLWSRQVRKEYGLDAPQWGFGASPLVLGDQVLLNYGKVLAFDAKTGEPAWQSPKDYGDAYSTPVDFVTGGKHALAVFGGDGLAVLGASDGKELAFTPWKTRYDVNAMTPIVFGDRIFISSGYDHGCALIELAGDGAKVLWSNKNMRNQMSGSVPWREHLYGFDDKVLKCLDLDGEELWRERGLGQGALAIAGGRLIVMSEDGELLIAQASPKGFEVLSRRKVFDGGTCWTVPVLANGVIYVRNQAGQLAALDHRAP